jgi:pyruvate dehydrogenase E2 component (dihydrolipoyllysine-residue acetyltransferase)
MDVSLPKLGEGADSGTVVSVLVKDGDEVKKGQTLIELENEKAVAPIPATVSGKIANVRVKEGDKISVGHIIITLAETGAEQPAAEPEAKSTAAPAPEKALSARMEDPAPDPMEKPEADESAPSAAKPGIEPPASPSIRKLARELGIDLHRIRGSERGGRIVMADIRAYIQRLEKLVAPAKSVSQKPAAPVAPAAERLDFSKWGPVTKKSLTPLRQTIGRRITESWNTIPHVTQFDEADITGLTELRNRFASEYDAKGTKLTLTPFALKAVAAALKKYPIFNASLDELASEIVFKEYYHIGLAVDTDAGLIVPVIRDVDKKSLLDLSREVHVLAKKARDRKIALEELRGGTFTISNQGGIGGAHFTPIVNKPEVAILGLGRGSLRPAVKDKQVVPRLMLPICISYDHRVIDGGTAARFTVDLIHALETFPESDVKLGR